MATTDWLERDLDLEEVRETATVLSERLPAHG
jgi:hypothetical protein